VTQDGLSQATLTSPIAGTVAQIRLSPGQSVTSSSSTATITVIGSGNEEVNTAVTLTDVGQLRVGDTATISVDGQSSDVSGTVSSIGVLSSTTGSTTTFPVTIVLAPTAARLFDGAGASVSIAVQTVSGVLTVPSSALHRLGAFYTVNVMKGGKLTPTRVTVGAVGPDRTEIRSGLSAGQQVVVAELNQPLPTNSVVRRFGGAATTAPSRPSSSPGG
jgi:multidrug efflux pump subunit AcrA (membrane-fusion protein)